MGLIAGKIFLIKREFSFFVGFIDLIAVLHFDFDHSFAVVKIKRCIIYTKCYGSPFFFVLYGMISNFQNFFSIIYFIGVFSSQFLLLLYILNVLLLIKNFLLNEYFTSLVSSVYNFGFY